MRKGCGRKNDNCQRWFALRVKSKYEKLVATMAKNKGFEDFLPTYQCRRRWSDRKVVEVPLFPGYVFCRLDPQHRLPVLTHSGRTPSCRNRQDPGSHRRHRNHSYSERRAIGPSTEPWPFLEAGQQVRLEEGRWRAWKGILIGTSKKDRLIVSVTLLKRSVAVAIERHWVTPLMWVACRPCSPSRSSSILLHSRRKLINHAIIENLQSRERPPARENRTLRQRVNRVE